MSAEEEEWESGSGRSELEQADGNILMFLKEIFTPSEVSLSEKDSHQSKTSLARILGFLEAPGVMDIEGPSHDCSRSAYPKQRLVWPFMLARFAKVALTPIELKNTPPGKDHQSPTVHDHFDCTILVQYLHRTILLLIFFSNAFY